MMTKTTTVENGGGAVAAAERKPYRRKHTFFDCISKAYTIHSEYSIRRQQGDVQKMRVSTLSLRSCAMKDCYRVRSRQTQ